MAHRCLLLFALSMLVLLTGCGSGGGGSDHGHEQGSAGESAASASPTPAPQTTPQPSVTPEVTPTGTPTPGGLVAGPLDPTVLTNTLDAAGFLYTGADAVQTGVAPGTIDGRRVAIVHGRVLTTGAPKAARLVSGLLGNGTLSRLVSAVLNAVPASTPLSGATVTVLSHPELGQTLTQGDGTFAMAVNGGGSLTFVVTKSGYAAVHRQVSPAWQAWGSLPDVVLLPLDANVTRVDFTQDVQVARGSAVSDADGTRQAVVLFKQGTQAAVVLPDGTSQPQASLHVRLTEFTVGASGPQAMPAGLPPASGYTWCCELTADEALAVGGLLSFSKPVIEYTDNFLGFPAGTIVPQGHYDRASARWVARSNGRVVKILAVSGATVSLDVDGNGQAATQAELDALGIDAAELGALATLYSPGQSLWRVPVTGSATGKQASDLANDDRLHGPFDLNWPYLPTPGAQPPHLNPSPSKDHDCPCETEGQSTVNVEDQILEEDVPLAGTALALHYQSDRVRGRTYGRTVSLQVSGATLPPSLKRIDVTTRVAGRDFTSSLPAQPNQQYTFIWDGKDVFGRDLNGPQDAEVVVGYVYDAVYASPATFNQQFGQFSGGADSFGYPTEQIGLQAFTIRARQEVVLFQSVHRTIGNLVAPNLGLGGWTIDVHHFYDSVNKMFIGGDGSRRSVESIAPVVTTVAGNGQSGVQGDGGPATQASLSTAFNGMFGLCAASDGSLYISQTADNVVRRVTPDGIIHTFAGGGTPADGVGDGLPATQAALTPSSVVEGPDGRIYIGDIKNGRIRVVGSDGLIHTVAGGGKPADGLGDGLQATQASLLGPNAAVMRDGSLVIGDDGHGRIRKVDPNGVIHTLAGNGTSGFSGDGGPATAATLGSNFGVVAAPDDTIWFWDRDNNRVRRIDGGGVIDTVAGGGSPPDGVGDGLAATKASIFQPISLCFDHNGGYFVSDQRNRVRYVGADGVITTVLGTGAAGFTPDGSPARATQVAGAYDFAVGPDGSFYTTDRPSGRVRRVALPFGGFGPSDFAVPSADGTVVYRFDSRGRHLSTLNALTGATLSVFGYDGNGQLTSVTDGRGSAVTFERGGDGKVLRALAPGGQATAFTYDANGYLASVQDGAGNRRAFGYSATGLLQSQTSPNGKVSQYSFDGSGMLLVDQDPGGGSLTLARTESPTGTTVTATTAMGRVTTHLSEDLPDGSERDTMTDPAGGISITVKTPDQTFTTTREDGTVTVDRLGPDPRFGMLAPLVVSDDVRTPGGLHRVVVRARSVSLASASDPLTLKTLTDSWSINGNTYSTTFDAATRTWHGTTPQGRTATRQLNDLGQDVSVASDSLAPVQTTYTAQGLPSLVAHGSERVALTYDAARHPVTLTDSLNDVTRLVFDGADRITGKTLAGGATYGFAYDADSNMTALTTPAKLSHTLSYDANDLLTGCLLAGGAAYAFSYDADRDSMQHTLPDGRTQTCAYDAGGRCSGLAYPEAQISVGYGDATSRPGTLVRQSAGGGATQQMAFTYDSDLIRSVTMSGPTAGQIQLSYDDRFQLVGMDALGVAVPLTRDSDGDVVGYGPFTLGRAGPGGALSSISDGTLSISYVTSPLGRVASRTHVAGGTFYALSVAYDDAGRVSSKTESVGGATHTYGYAYDSDGQLTQVQKDGAVAESYAYDASGNRTSAEVVPGPAQAAAYDVQDRLVTLGATTYTSDASGFVVGRGTDSFSWSARTELLSATVGGQPITYGYDALGHLVHRAEGPATVQLFYTDTLPDARVVASIEGGATTVYFYDDQADLFALVRGAATYYVGCDQAGTPKIVVDAGGTPVRVIDYDAWGRVTSDSNPSFFLPVGFGGGVPDARTGLVRLGTRDYDPLAGRFVARNPALLGGNSFNLYAYADNDPVGRIDRSGLDYARVGETVDLGQGYSYTVTPGGVIVHSPPLIPGGTGSNEFHPGTAPFQVNMPDGTVQRIDPDPAHNKCPKANKPPQRKAPPKKQGSAPPPPTRKAPPARAHNPVRSRGDVSGTIHTYGEGYGPSVGTSGQATQTDVYGQIIHRGQ